MCSPVLFVAAQSENRYFLGVMITLLGVGSLIWALGRDHDRIREEVRYTRPWVVDRLAGLQAAWSGRQVFTLLSLGIIALGVTALAGA